MGDTPMDWGLFAGVMLGSIAGGVATLWAVSAYYHYKYYVRRRDQAAEWKCQPKRFLNAKQMREVMWMSTINLTIGGIISGLGVFALLRGWDAPKLYFDVDDYGWAWTIGGTVVFFLIADACAYYAHRFMHVRFMFKHIHRWHHRYVATVPWVVTTMHPVEFIVFQFVTLVWLFIIPFHYVSVIVVLLYILIFNIIDHSGVNLKSRIPWQGPSLYHDDHHKFFHVNFGQHLMIWDKMHGTLRREGRKYGAEVFGGKGQSAIASPTNVPPFIDYEAVAGRPR